MIINIARPDGHPAPAPGHGPSLDERTVEPGSPTVRERLLALVGQDKRVLELGCAAGSLARELRARGCRVVVVDDPDRGGLDRAREPGEDRFEVVVADGVLERLKDPESVLRAARDLLEPGGSLVATLPNVAHGSVRLALWGGRFPDVGGVLDRSHLRFFTRDSAIRLFEEAGFAIGHLEPRESPIVDPDARAEATALPPGLLEALGRDPEARVHQYLVVAHPTPQPGLNWVQDRLRDAAERAEAATREADDLRRVVDAMTAQVEAQHRRAEALATRERETRFRLLDAHEELARQADEFRAQVRHLAAQRDALEARILRIRRSPPGRLYLKVRALLKAGRGGAA